ncbi:MAG: sugar phosphate isomerase/epimerase [Anaerolineae bacterium]|nr:sugar phosphate isomerase/epimerase [Anaerolineae bacterium]
MTYDIALSTMWAVGRFPDLAGFFDAGRELGFARFELNHAIDSAMLAGLSLDGTITGIHEPCPADISTAELSRRNWLISAPDEKDRRRGVLATRRSIDLAYALGAPAVIVHPGRVDVDPALESALVDLHKAGRSSQPEYDQTKARLMAARTARARTNMQSVRRSLIELAGYAAHRGIRLGLENRFHYREIPLPDELEELLDLGLGQAVGYWHDIGHAQVLEHLGFDPHEEWLRRFADRMIGVHLHDVVGVTDHLPAGSGEVDWAMVRGYLPAGVLRTCEFQSSHPPQQVAAGLHWLVDKRI